MVNNHCITRNTGFCSDLNCRFMLSTFSLMDMPPITTKTTYPSICNQLSVTIKKNYQFLIIKKICFLGATCYKDLCVGLSSGTASSVDIAGCGCQCMPNLPVFRDDLNICVDDIHGKSDLFVLCRAAAGAQKKDVARKGRKSWAVTCTAYSP